MNLMKGFKRKTNGNGDETKKNKIQTSSDKYDEISNGHNSSPLPLENKLFLSIFLIQRN